MRLSQPSLLAEYKAAQHFSSRPVFPVRRGARPLGRMLLLGVFLGLKTLHLFRVLEPRWVLLPFRDLLCLRGLEGSF